MPTNSFKCVLVGEGGVGKSTHVKQLITRKFDPKYVATLGVEVYPFKFAGCNLVLWDTAGQEKFGGLRDGYYIQADCGMVCFDLSSRASWNKVPQWLNSLSQYTDCLVLVGFKSDLPPKVTPQEIATFSAENNIPYHAISNKVPKDTLAVPIANLVVKLSKLI